MNVVFSFFAIEQRIVVGRCVDHRRNRGYKGYEMQAIESLLVQLEATYYAQRGAEKDSARHVGACDLRRGSRAAN